MSDNVNREPGRVHDAIADALVQSGVRCIFGVMGEDTAPLVVAVVARGIAYYAARHENQAVAMADGYSRASGRVGVATVTGGPGFTNALTAIHTAHRAGSRVAVLVGAGRAEEDDHDPGIVRQANGASWLKYFPHAKVMDVLGMPFVKPLTAATAVRDTHRALALARQGTVALVLGRPLLLAPLPAAPAEPAEPAPPPATPANAPCRLPREQIVQLADLLEETWAVKQPLILAGHGAVVSGAGPVLQRLAERIGALLATSLRGRALFHGDPYSLGLCGSFATPVASGFIPQADCVLAFGASLNPWTTFNNSLFPKALLVQVDTEQQAIGRIVPAALGIQGDAREVAEALLAELERRRHAATGWRNERTREAIAAFRKDADVVDRSTDTLIDPRTLMLALDRMLPADRIVCADAGQQGRFAVRYLETNRPDRFMQALDAGGLGLGFGAAIGAAVARPGELVVAAVGDGGAMMALGDLESAVRFGLPLLVVLSNDESFGAEVNVLANLGMDTRLADTPSPSFEAVALALGARAATVRRVQDLEVIEPWWRQRPGVPLVLDCRVNPQVRAE